MIYRFNCWSEPVFYASKTLFFTKRGNEIDVVPYIPFQGESVVPDLTRPQPSLLSPKSAAEGNARGDGKEERRRRFLPSQHPPRLATPNKGDKRDDWGRDRCQIMFSDIKQEI